MEGMTGQASCLIKTREHHVGFPALFSHRPEGMEQQTLTLIHDFVSSAMMDGPHDIVKSGEKVRKLVVGTGNYLVMGVYGFLHDIIPNSAIKLNDWAGRPSHGFVGLVWNLDACPAEALPTGFPTLNAFSQVLADYIIPHWMESENSPWADNTRMGMSVPFRYAPECPPFLAGMDTPALNFAKEVVQLYPRGSAHAMLSQALNLAKEKMTVSACTEISFNAYKGNSFLNITTGTAQIQIRENVWYLPKHSPKTADQPAEEQKETDGNSSDRYAFNPKGLFSKNAEPESAAKATGKKAFSGLSWKKTTQPEKEKPAKQRVDLVMIYDPADESYDFMDAFINTLIHRLNNKYQEELSLGEEDIRPGLFGSMQSKCVLPIYLPEEGTIEDIREEYKSLMNYFVKTGYIYWSKRYECWAICGAPKLTIKIYFKEGKKPGLEKYIQTAAPQPEPSSKTDAPDNIDLIDKILQSSTGVSGSKPDKDIFDF